MSVIINGDTGIDKITDGSVVAADIGAGEVTQAKLASGVAGTGPSFRAYMSAVTAVSNSGATKLVMDTEDWDTDGCFDSTTNYRFTPTVAGYYHLTGAMFMSTGTSARVGVAIYKNGSEHQWNFIAGTSALGGNNPNVSAIVYANGSTDYFELYGAQTHASSVNASNSNVVTWFSGALVRAV